MVSRLTRQVTDALAIVEDQHAIAIEAADDRARRARAKRPLGDPWLRGDCRAQRTLQLLGQILAGQHGRRLIGIELVPRVGADRDDLTVVQLGIDRDVQGQRRLDDVELGSRWNESLGRHQQMVRTRRHVGNRVGAVGPRFGLECGSFDRDRGVRDRFRRNGMIKAAGYRNTLGSRHSGEPEDISQRQRARARRESTKRHSPSR